MSHSVIRSILTLTLLALAIATGHAQVASYNFNQNAEDQVGENHATIFGTPTFENSEYISFTPGEYLSLPLAVSQAIDVSESWQFQFRFKVEGDWRATDDEEAQVIVSSKVFDQRVGGFDITAREWGGQLQLITTFGDGITYEPFGCPTCGGHEGWSEGKLDWVIAIDSGIWYEVKIKFFFDGDRPYIQYEVNGTVSISFFDERVDAEGFRQTINKQQIWVGADQEYNHNIHHSETPRMDLQIDYLSFWSPVPPGDPQKVGLVLQTLIDQMNLPQTGGDTGANEEELTDEQIDSLRVEFVKYWDDQSYDNNKEVIWEYINTYAGHHEPIFNQWINVEAPQDFAPMEAIQYLMEQWILDNRYAPETVSEMSGLVFEDHELFPGKVSPRAPRLEEAFFVIDGDYETNPGFQLNGQEEVIRLTGYYVPPGELVTITIPDEVINQGLSMFVGAHNANLQHTWSEFRRFPRIMTVYELDAKTITVTNPFGGGIYIKVPDGSSFGLLEFEVNGAVKAPYYSKVEGFGRSLEEFKADLANQYVPWVDIESRNFMATITAGMVSVVTDIDSAITIWDQSFDAVNTALGRPLERFRAEYLLMDRQNHYQGTALPASYPMPFERYFEPYAANSEMPMRVERGRDWYNAKDDNFHNIVFHEQGHLHNMPTLLHEQETNVHIPATAIYSMVMGESIDSAMVYSNQQKINLDQSAMDWMLVDNFYLGNRIGYLIEQERFDWGEQAYQARGHAKYIEVANLFGWEALGKTMSPFIERQINDPFWSPYSLKDDEYIDTASHALGFNMAPHFEFWGIIPSDELVDKLKDMPTSDVIKDRLIHFRSLVPANNEEFQEWHRIMTSKLEWHHHVRYDQWKTSYDEEHAQRIIDRIDEILNKYYEIDALDYNQDPVITGISDELYVHQNTSLTLELSHFLVEDADNDYPDDFTLSVVDGNNYAVSGTIITPSTDFLGELKVSVTVNDGQEDSEPFEATIEVVVENDRPVVSGLTSAITMVEDEEKTITLGDFAVEDADHNYPDDFTLQLMPGEHYTLSGNTIIPESNFFGNIEVPLKVSDGVQESKIFLTEITVAAVNDPPRILGPARLAQVREDESKHFKADEFIVDDPDDEPGYYFVEILEGENYAVSNNTVTPDKDFYGMLLVNMVANDEKEYGEPYQLLVEVYNVNDAPVINGVVGTLLTRVNESLSLSVSNFDIDDPDDDEFSLTLMAGENYTLSGLTITPGIDFTGELKVPVKVNDGELHSNEFTATITVHASNDRPVITGLVSPITTEEDTPFSISLSDLVVEDSDHNYPDDFSLRLFAGEHYTLAGDGNDQIIPEADYFGQLAVPVTVDDGIEESEQFLITIEVTAVNDLPVILGLTAALSTNEDESITISVEQFNIKDPDNSFPDDFSLTLIEGENYTFSATTVSPVANFAGSLSVPVTVSDGTGISEPFEVPIEVLPVNDAPAITGLASSLNTDTETPLTLSLTDFTVNDPDNDYPDDFTLTVLSGDNYDHSGSTLTPTGGFIGTLNVPVTVNDGAAESEQFVANVNVSPVLGFENAWVSQHFAIYPNPTKNYLNLVKDAGIAKYEVRLISPKGDVALFETGITEEKHQIDLSLLSDGMYILQISSSQGTGNFKVIRQ